ncbi:MAG: hypothetical protein AAF429_10990 [Pseudomonadota bacterium]
MITPKRLIVTGLLCYVVLFAFGGATALLSISQEPWAEDVGKVMFIIFIYARFYLRWIGLLLLIAGIGWLISNWIKSRGAEDGL